MKEHPIPQDVISYRFHIVGNMTLRQFLEIAGGVVLAVIFYKTGLPGIIKWPFVFLFAVAGATAAFVPIAERPLDHWIVTYLNIMFKPTKYFWKKTASIPSLFTHKPIEPNANYQAPLNIAPIKQKQVGEFVASIKQEKKPGANTLEEKDETKVLSYFEETQAKQISPPPAQTNIVSKNPSLTKEVFDAKKKVSAGVVQLAQTPKLALGNKQETQVAHQDQKTQNVVYVAQVPKALEPPPAITTTSKVASTNLSDGTFNQNLPFPAPPSQPNTLVGMVLNQKGEMIPGAIIEVTNQSGQVERAVKSNALGQFFITTPLSPAPYTIRVEADNFTFEPFGFTTNNHFLPPLEIRSLE